MLRRHRDSKICRHASGVENVETPRRRVEKPGYQNMVALKKNGLLVFIDFRGPEALSDRPEGLRPHGRDVQAAASFHDGSSRFLIKFYHFKKKYRFDGRLITA